MKKTIHLSGRVMLPLKAGKRATIFYAGDYIFTSRVVEIIEISEYYVHFETMNSIYKVSLIPQTTTAPLPTEYAKCA